MCVCVCMCGWAVSEWGLEACVWRSCGGGGGGDGGALYLFLLAGAVVVDLFLDVGVGLHDRVDLRVDRLPTKTVQSERHVSEEDSEGGGPCDGGHARRAVGLGHLDEVVQREHFFLVRHVLRHQLRPWSDEKGTT